MPGIVGMIGDCASSESMAKALTTIHHFASYSRDQVSPFANVEIGQVWRRSKDAAKSWCEDKASGVCLYINGTVLLSGPNAAHLSASSILRAYLEGDLSPERYDGSFVMCIADPRSREVIILNDRLGTLPVYYYDGARSFCFSPEPKAIYAATGIAREYTETGIVTFLTIGYCLAGTTQFNDIKCLEPGSLLRVDVEAHRISRSRYWMMDFEPDPDLRSRRNAEEALFQSITRGHRTVFAGDDEQYDILLSGGWDSRGMLATACALNRMPRRSLSWGLRDDIPLSDPALARDLAAQYGVDHHFIAYDTDSFIENADQWSYLTELNTDNFGWYGEGTSILLNHYATGADFVVAGDECWGTKFHSRNLGEAMAENLMPATVPTAVVKCLNRRVATECVDRYLGEISSVLQACKNSSLDEQKDFLYLHGRVARFIFSLGYYKELAVEVRRPFLCGNVVDQVQRIPNRFRYDKNVYISMLIRYYPELFRVPKRSASSLPKWRRDLRENPRLSSYFRDLLSKESLAKSSVSEFMDIEEVGRLASRFFSTPYVETGDGIDKSARWGPLSQSLKQRAVSWSDVLIALRLKSPARYRFDDFDLLRRIALVTLFERGW